MAAPRRLQTRTAASSTSSVPSSPRLASWAQKTRAAPGHPSPASSTTPPALAGGQEGPGGAPKESHDWRAAFLAPAVRRGAGGQSPARATPPADGGIQKWEEPFRFPAGTGADERIDDPLLQLRINREPSRR